MTGEHLSKQDQERLPIKIYPCFGWFGYRPRGHLYVVMQGDAPKDSIELGEMPLAQALELYPDGEITQSDTLCKGCRAHVDELTERLKNKK